MDDCFLVFGEEAVDSEHMKASTELESECWSLSCIFTSSLLTRINEVNLKWFSFQPRYQDVRADMQAGKARFCLLFDIVDLLS